MNKNIIIKDLVFDFENIEDIEMAARLLINRLNELRPDAKEKYYLGTLKYMGRLPKKERRLSDDYE